jgi:hypothetical protein
MKESLDKGSVTNKKSLITFPPLIDELNAKAKIPKSLQRQFLGQNFLQKDEKTRVPGKRKHPS